MIRTGVPGGRPEPPEAIIAGDNQSTFPFDLPENFEGGTEPWPGRPKSICLWSNSEFPLYFRGIFRMDVAVSGQHPLTLRVGNFSNTLEDKVVNSVPWPPLNLNFNLITFLELLNRLETFTSAHDAAVPEWNLEAGHVSFN